MFAISYRANTLAWRYCSIIQFLPDRPDLLTSIQPDGQSMAPYPFIVSWSSFFLFDVAGEISELTSTVRKQWSLIKKAELQVPIQLHWSCSEVMLLQVCSVYTPHTLLRAWMLSNLISIPDTYCFNATEKKTCWLNSFIYSKYNTYIMKCSKINDHAFCYVLRLFRS